MEEIPTSQVTIHVDQDQNLLGGIYVLRGKTKDGGDFTAIPFQL